MQISEEASLLKAKEAREALVTQLRAVGEEMKPLMYDEESTDDGCSIPVINQSALSERDKWIAQCQECVRSTVAELQVISGAEVTRALVGQTIDEVFSPDYFSELLPGFDDYDCKKIGLTSDIFRAACRRVLGSALQWTSEEKDRKISVTSRREPSGTETKPVFDLDKLRGRDRRSSAEVRCRLVGWLRKEIIDNKDLISELPKTHRTISEQHKELYAVQIYQNTTNPVRLNKYIYDGKWMELAFEMAAQYSGLGFETMRTAWKNRKDTIRDSSQA